MANKGPINTTNSTPVPASIGPKFDETSRDSQDTVRLQKEDRENRAKSQDNAKEAQLERLRAHAKRLGWRIQDPQDCRFYKQFAATEAGVQVEATVDSDGEEDPMAKIRAWHKVASAYIRKMPPLEESNYFVRQALRRLYDREGQSSLHPPEKSKTTSSSRSKRVRRTDPRSMSLETGDGVPIWS